MPLMKDELPGDLIKIRGSFSAEPAQFPDSSKIRQIIAAPGMFYRRLYSTKSCSPTPCAELFLLATLSASKNASVIKSIAGNSPSRPDPDGAAS